MVAEARVSWTLLLLITLGCCLVAEEKTIRFIRKLYTADQGTKEDPL